MNNNITRSIVMQSYVPELIRDSRIFSALLAAEGSELDALISSQQDILKQFYVETATDWGLDLWEEMLGLPNYADDKNLDRRRSRIISKLRGMGTVTIALIKNVAESYSYGTVAVTEHPDTYSFTVTFIDEHGIPANYTDLQTAIERIKPAHLTVDYVLRYLIWNELDALSLTWDQLDGKKMMWNEFELGGWIDA